MSMTSQPIASWIQSPVVISRFMAVRVNEFVTGEAIFSTGLKVGLKTLKRMGQVDFGCFKSEAAPEASALALQSK